MKAFKEEFMNKWPDERDPWANAMKNTKPLEEMEKPDEKQPSLDSLIKPVKDQSEQQE